jgi:hypothetical protein
LKEEALDRTIWRARFGRSFGPVVRQTTWINSSTAVMYSSRPTEGSLMHTSSTDGDFKIRRWNICERFVLLVCIFCRIRHCLTNMFSVTLSSLVA